MNQQYPQQPQEPHQFHQPDQPHPPHQQYPPQSGWGGPPQQPGYGAPPQQPPYGAPPQHPFGVPPQQPAYGVPPQQPPKKRGVGKMVGLGAAGLVVLFILIGVVAGGGDSGGDGGKDKTAVAGDERKSDDGAKDGAEGGAAQEKGDAEPADEAGAQGPVKVTAKKTAFAKTILADGDDYTSVLVTITNNGDEQVDVNPLYFSITDTKGTKHTIELAADENQIDTVNLAPGENISGTVTGKGTFTAQYVTFTDGLLGDPIRADVS
ncbi:DUF4352 domain-containing protein [Streptomyces sp. NPDC052020]|uniref:DUF4352 domain-containing protein n=1 Tax=Streptomyces sp. NPDC052020 TaxID=3155677 RepID=UPI003421B50C